MNIKSVQDAARQFVEENSTTLLTAGGVVGTVATGVIAWRGGYTTAEKILAEEDKRKADTVPESPGQVGAPYVPLKTTEKVLLALPTTTPAVITGGATIVAIIFSHRMSAQKATALAAAYGLSQKQFDEYRNKVAEKLTGPKREQIKDELAQERVNRSSGYDKIVVIDGSEVLCYDSPNDRYFRASMEKINRAVNAVNAEIMNHGSAPATLFYDELELKSPQWTQNLGWNMDNLLDLEISMSETPDNRPCIAFEFSRFPIEDWQRTQY